jgi:hypothetical protein
VGVSFSDEQIEVLIREPKPLPKDYRKRLALRDKRGHREQELAVPGSEGHEFHIILRQSSTNPLNFSVILGVTVPDTNRMFKLRRYNSRTHGHSNQLEGTDFALACHIHQATARYQDAGGDEEAYAEATDRFWDLPSALDCMLHDCGFILPEGTRLGLFEEVT